MIHHHAQGVQMTALVADRAQAADLPVMAKRMDVSQSDEIVQMERWLAVRGEEVPSAAQHSGHGGHGAHGGMLMPGMLTEEQMAALATATGPAFDRLFLESMISHHQGALVMVADLWVQGGGQDPELFRLAQHIDSDQAIEISRMSAMLSALAVVRRRAADVDPSPAPESLFPPTERRRLGSRVILNGTWSEK